MRNRIIALLVLILLFFIPARGFALTVSAGRHRDHGGWGFTHRDGVVLVLSGGGTKGLAHVGVIEVLERENIPIAAIVGTSMGGIVGGLYAAGYTTAEMRQVLQDSDLMEIMSDRTVRRPPYSPGYNKPPSSGTAPFNVFRGDDWRYTGNLGLMRGKDLYAFLSGLTSRVTVIDFNRLPVPFAAVATDLGNGDTVIMRDGNLASALRATMSIPILFEPWEIGGRLLVDGGLKANLPVLVAKEIFPGHPVLAVNLSPEDITMTREQMKGVFEVTAQTLEILMVEQVRYNAAAADMVITPAVSDFGVLASGGYDKIIERGFAAADEKVDELRALWSSGNETFAYQPDDEWLPPVPIVTSIRFDGIPETVAEELEEKYEDWIDRPLDMKKVSETIKELSLREDFLRVDVRTQHITEETVEVVFSIDRPKKYELGLGGFASNLSPSRWMNATLTARDMVADGDVTSLGLRFSDQWGAQLQYFSPLDERDRQFAVTLSAHKEEFSPRGYGDLSLERYAARAVYYKDFGRGLRLGGGYAVDRTTSEGDGTVSGPYLDFTYINLDNPILPSKGMAILSQLWYPLDETLLSRTTFHVYLPVWEKQKAVLKGGLKTGDGRLPAYAAMLGSQMELYSLAQKPLMGDQAWWLHLGASTTLMKTWWGGVHVEAFGRYGEVMNDWSRDASWWELGLNFQFATNVVPGGFFMVYDQGGGVTFGYSLGVPAFRNGPLP